MKKSKFIILILTSLLFTSCSQGITVFVKIFGLDDNSEKLEIEFDFTREDEKVAVSHIEIYLNNSLSYELVSESKSITNWRFPELPEGFKITYPLGVDTIQTFSKTDDLRFAFKGRGKYLAHGSWTYKPIYATQNYRWLFDQDGNKKINIDCSYEPWIGKDIIKIVANDTFEIDPKSFQLHDMKNEPVEFKLKSKNDSTNRVALAVKKKFKKGDILLLSFKAHDDQMYTEKIIVPSRSTIGIAGKYNFL